MRYQVDVSLILVAMLKATARCLKCIGYVIAMIGAILMMGSVFLAWGLAILLVPTWFLDLIIHNPIVNLVMFCYRECAVTEQQCYALAAKLSE